MICVTRERIMSDGLQKCRIQEAAHLEIAVRAEQGGLCITEGEHAILQLVVSRSLSQLRNSAVKVACKSLMCS